jgi:hypothetical protein
MKTLAATATATAAATATATVVVAVALSLLAPRAALAQPVSGRSGPETYLDLQLGAFIPQAADLDAFDPQRGHGVEVDGDPEILAGTPD